MHVLDIVGGRKAKVQASWKRRSLWDMPRESLAWTAASSSARSITDAADAWQLSNEFCGSVKGCSEARRELAWQPARSRAGFRLCTSCGGAQSRKRLRFTFVAITQTHLHTRNMRNGNKRGDHDDGTTASTILLHKAQLVA